MPHEVSLLSHEASLLSHEASHQLCLLFWILPSIKVSVRVKVSVKVSVRVRTRPTRYTSGLEFYLENLRSSSFNISLTLPVIVFGFYLGRLGTSL